MSNLYKILNCNGFTVINDDGNILCCRNILSGNNIIYIKYYHLKINADLIKMPENLFIHNSDMSIIIMDNYQQIESLLFACQKDIISLMSEKIFIINDSQPYNNINLINLNSYRICNHNEESWINLLLNHNIRYNKDNPIYTSYYDNPLLEFGNFYLYIYILLFINNVKMENILITYFGDNYIIKSVYNN